MLVDLETYNAPKVSVDVPANFEIDVRDYHEFNHIKYLLKDTIGLDYNFEEVGCDGHYHAVFWMGEKPVDLIEATKKTYED